MSASAYEALKPTDSAAHTKSVLDGIANAMPFTFSEEQRQTLVQGLLDDVRSPDKRIGQLNVATALNTVKMLGRQPSIASVIATKQNLELLASTMTNEDTQVAYNAMKVVANTLLLVLDNALDKWLATDGPVAAIRVLNSRSEPEPVFLASRILFLTTVKQTAFVKEAVETHGLQDILASSLLPTVELYIAGKQWGKDASIDLLKVCFNLLLHYPRLLDAANDPSAAPKAMGEGWNPRLEPLVVPILATFYRIPPANPPSAPLVAPLTHVVNSLINLPIKPYAAVWFNQQESDPSTSAVPAISTTAASPSSGPPSPSDTASAADAPAAPELVSTPKESNGLQRVLKLLPTMRTPISKGKERRNSKESSGRSMSPGSGRRSTSSRPSSPHSASQLSSVHSSPKQSSTPALSPPEGDVIKKAFELLEVVTAWYFPDALDPDDSSIRDRATKEDVQLDHLVSPLIVLLTRLAAGNEPARLRLREWLIPAHLDRTRPLEERPDTLGRCLRLLKSVYFQRVKETVGEFLFTICDSDATVLAGQVGYGNVAGYLFNRGLVAPPPPTSPTRDSPLPEGEINPITGMRVDPNEQPGASDMTDEEKEREAERLFVLFDRLERTGMGVQNPFRKAFEEGKIQYP
ncbi:guanine nucleotide exchange factor [Auriculariales sp. MPI-PUGE-AT-0066]|nr:guanine nucleotide exchange factor [Auriculariales sp. MPI-PUGE-AT-0066]